MVDELRKILSTEKYSETRNEVVSADKYVILPDARDNTRDRSTRKILKRSDFDTDQDFAMAIDIEGQKNLLGNDPEISADDRVFEDRSKRHTNRMARLGPRLPKAKRMDDQSLITASDAILRPMDGSDNVLRVSPNEADLSMENGQGGFRMTDQRSQFKKVVAIDFENRYTDINMDGEQFDPSLNMVPTSVIFARPAIAQQIFPDELIKIAGLAKQMKSILGFLV